jgi:hypothetical protein
MSEKFIIVDTGSLINLDASGGQDALNQLTKTPYRVSA